MTRITYSHFVIANRQVHWFGGFSCDSNVVIAGEADHVGELPAPSRIGKMTIFWALEGDTSLDADPGTSTSKRADTKDEDVIRPARVTHDVVALEVFPQNPVVDARTTHPPFEQSMREDFRANLPARQIHSQQLCFHDDLS